MPWRYMRGGGGETYLHSFLTSTLGGGEWFVYYKMYVVGYEVVQQCSQQLGCTSRAHNMNWKGWGRWRSGPSLRYCRDLLAYYKVCWFPSRETNPESPKCETGRQHPASSSNNTRVISHTRIFISPFPPLKSAKGLSKIDKRTRDVRCYPESGAMTSPPDVTHFTTTSAVQ